MNLFLKLAYVFFKVGLLTIGGGLAMIPIIQYEMVSRGWLDNQQFLDILGIAQMTPGPMSVNTATLVGYRVIAGAGAPALWMAVAGALVSTLAVCAPSLICINLFGTFWSRNRDHPGMARVFNILRPLVSGLIITAAALLVLNALWGDSFRDIFNHLPPWHTTLIAVAAFLLTAFSRLSPVYLLLGGAALGYLLQIG